MNKQVSLSRYILVILCVSIVFTAIVLVALNAWTQNNRLNNLPGLSQLTGGSYDQGYKDGYNVAREKLRNRPPLPVDVPIMGISGTIQSISDTQIVVRATNLDTDQMVDGVSDDRTVIIDAQTKISSRAMLSPEEQSKQLDAWSALKDKDKGNKALPLPYSDVTMKSSDLKVGQTVTVMASEDIRLQPSFHATQILVTGQASTSTGQ